MARLKARPALWLAVVLPAGVLLTALAAMAAGEAGELLPGVSLVRVAFGTVVAVAALLFGARWLMRFTGAQGVASVALRVVASLPIGQRERVVVVQVGERQVMLGVAPGRVALLQELGECLPAGSREQNAAGVPAAAWLARVLGKGA